MLTSKKSSIISVFSIQNKAPNPDDFGGMTQCFDMQAENKSYFVYPQSCYLPVPQEIQRDSHGNN